jgi:hypothetical protein
MADNENENPPAGDPVEEPAVTGRPVDVASPNSTFAERAKAASKVVKAESAEDKAVAPAKATRKRR